MYNEYVFDKKKERKTHTFTFFLYSFYIFFLIIKNIILNYIGILSVLLLMGSYETREHPIFSHCKRQCW